MTAADRFVTEASRRIPIVADVDVVVVGGGPSGVASAIAATRTGAQVLVVERAGFYGGTATGAMVASFMGHCWRDRRVSGGIAEEIVHRLIAEGGGRTYRRYVMAEASSQPYETRTFPFDPEVLKFVLDDLIAEAGVQALLHAAVVGPLQDDPAGPVSGVVVETRSGRQAVRARVVIDAGADGFVARAAGARALNADQPVAERQPMTLMARLTEVDVARFRALPREEKQRLSAAGMDSGELAQRILALVSSPTGSDAFILMTRVSGFDGADSAGLTGAELAGRRQIRTVLAFLRREVPGFEKAQLVSLAPWIGVRETWQIAGDYVLSADDVLTGAQFADGIALGGGPLDLHHPTGGGITLQEPEQPFATPYRCLLPTGVEGLLVTGRAASATLEAHGALRHMGSVMCLGHAAGTAAALAAKHGLRPRTVDTNELRNVLRDQGAILDLDAVLPLDPALESA